jgi:hypothetical protein
LVTVWQLHQLGVAEQAIAYRTSVGRLHLIFRGVYADHSEITQKARFLAAVLSVGPDALLSHRSAAILWGFWPGDPGDPGDPDDETTPVDVTVPWRIRQRDDGIRIHVAGSRRKT